MLRKGSTAIERPSVGMLTDLLATGAGSGLASAEGTGAGSACSASTGPVLVTPCGPMSKAHAIRTAIGKPSATSTITRVGAQSGKFRPGNTVEATSMTIQPATAYRAMTRKTRRRRNSAMKLAMTHSSTRPDIERCPRPTDVAILSNQSPVVLDVQKRARHQDILPAKGPAPARAPAPAARPGPATITRR